MKKYSITKKAFSLALMLCLLIPAFVGCTSNDITASPTPDLSSILNTTSTPQPTPEPTQEPTPTIGPTTAAAKPISPKNTYTSTVTDSKGYIIQATLNLTDWIKGSELPPAAHPKQ